MKVCCFRGFLWVQGLNAFLPLVQCVQQSVFWAPNIIPQSTWQWVLSCWLKYWSDLGWQFLCSIKVKQFRCNKSFSKGSSIYYA